MRFYILPLEQITYARAPKYFAWFNNPVGLDYSPDTFDYGLENVCIAAVDLLPADHTALIANADVLALPVNLDNNLTTGAVTQAQTLFESLNIPANWIDTSYTYRQVLKALLVIFYIVQRFNGLGGGKLFDTDTLATTYSSLSTAKKTKLQEMATDLSLDTSGVTGATTVRQILINMRNQLDTLTIPLGGEVF